MKSLELHHQIPRIYLLMSTLIFDTIQLICKILASSFQLKAKLVDMWLSSTYLQFHICLSPAASMDSVLSLVVAIILVEAFKQQIFKFLPPKAEMLI